MSENRIYLFDVDGTLTEPRKRITKKELQLLTEWLALPSAAHRYIVTGSDPEKLEEQLPKEVIAKFTGVFTCLGNQYSESGKVVYTNEFPEDNQLLSDCGDFIRKSNFPLRYGNHIERRVGMINVSSCGRLIPHTERKKYASFDKVEKEREAFVERMSQRHSDYDFSVGGEISIDISLKGKDKSQVLDYLQSSKGISGKEIVFYGDKCEVGGNDHSLAEAVLATGGTVVQVYHHSSTYEHLLEELSRE